MTPILDMILAVTLRLMIHSSARTFAIMLKNFRRKLATTASKVARRARAHAAFRRPTDSSSDGEPLPDPWKRILPRERASSPRPGLRKKRKTGVKKLAESEKNESHLKLDSDDRTAPDVSIPPPPDVKEQEEVKPQSFARRQSSSRQQEAQDSIIGNEDMKIITIHTPNQQHRALLMPPFTYRRTRALVHARQDLRAVESELATTTTEMDNLVVAQNELEEQDYREVPGAFLDDNAYADRERRQLLMTTIKKKIKFCELTLEDSEVQKPQLEADVEALQEQFLDDLERAVRDDVVAGPSRFKAGGSGKAGAWTTM